MGKAPNPVAVYPAIARFAPLSVSRIANQVLNPELERNVAMVVARPKSIRRVPANLVADVLGRIDSVSVLTSLISVGDKRRAMRDTLAKHPKYARAFDRNIDLNHPWATDDLDTVIATVDTILRERSLSRDEIRLVVTWCRRQHGETRAIAYRRLYNLDFSGRTAIVDLYVDVITGSVPGVTPADLGHEIDPEQPLRIPNSRYNRLDVLNSYPRLTLSLAQVCTANRLNVPLDSVDEVDDAAFEHLLRSSSAVELIEKGLLDDPRRLLPFIADFDERSRAQLAQRVSDPEVVAALVKDIPYGRRTYVDLYHLLNNVPDLDRDTRMVLLTYASTTELRDYLNGMTLNQPETGDGALIVHTILDPHKNRWNLHGAASLAHAIGLCAPTSAATEAVNTYLDIVEGLTDTILANHGVLGRFAVERITATLGNDSEKWEMLLRLSPDWSGTLDGLITTAAVL